MISINKAHREFYSLDLENGWEVPQGYPVGIEQKILSGSLDEVNRTGMLVTSGVSVCTGYTQLVSSQKFGSRTGGSVAREDEIILKSDTTYCRRFLSGAASNGVGFKAMWYELENK